MGMAVGNNLIKRNRGERQLSWLPRKVTPLLSGCIPHPYSNNSRPELLWEELTRNQTEPMTQSNLLATTIMPEMCT